MYSLSKSKKSPKKNCLRSYVKNYNFFIHESIVTKFHSPLHNAIRLKDKAKVCELLDQGADANVTNNLQQTPLHYALKYRNHKIVEILIKHGVDLEKQDNQNFTALGYAIQTGDVGSLELLLQYGANVNQEQGKEKYTPLIIALENSNYQLAQLLINFGANMNFNYLINSWASRNDVLDLFVTNGFKFDDFYKIGSLHVLIDVCKYKALRGYEEIKQEDCLDQKNDNCYKKCIDELEEMKTIYLDEGISSYDCLKAPRNKLINYSKNKNLRDTLERLLKDGKFTIYQNMLKINIFIGDRYALLYDKVSFDDFAGRYSLPILVRDNVLQYLNERDINNFLRAQSFD